MTFSSSDLLIGLSVLALLTIGLVIGCRWLLRKRSEQVKYNISTNISDRNKYPSVNAFRWSGTFFMIALVMALSSVVMAFNWTQYEPKTVELMSTLSMSDEIMVAPPRTTDPPPALPPPPVVIEPMPEDDLIDEDITFDDQLIDETTIVDVPKPIAVQKTPSPAPVIALPKDEPTNEIFVIVESMPRFPGCEEDTSLDKKEREHCALVELNRFLYKNLKYPAIARENGVDGTCVVQFVVDEKGRVNELTLVRDIGAGCGAEAMRVMQMMQDQNIEWIPGKQRTENVKVRMTLPIKFKLQ